MVSSSTNKSLTKRVVEAGMLEPLGGRGAVPVGAHAFPYFARSINPISIRARGADYAFTFYSLITICPTRFSDPPTSLSRRKKQRRLRLCFLAFESVFHSSCVRGACWAPAALPKGGLILERFSFWVKYVHHQKRCQITVLSIFFWCIALRIVICHGLAPFLEIWTKVKKILRLSHLK